MSFAFKIDKALRANLYKICRLCGIDRDETVPILSGENSQNTDEELELHEKIKELIGILISKDDKMPQSACTLCVDKINDFYEFREMCYATNIQTRKLLGLKGDGLKKAPIAEVKLPVVVKEESPFLKRMRKRKADESSQNMDLNDVKRETGAQLAPNKKQRLAKQTDKSLKLKEEIKDEPVDVATTTTTNTISKFRQICNICEQRFGSKAKLEAHQVNTHVPNIPRYVCTACDETIKKAIDIKNHQLWHKLSKTPYTCGLCGQSLTSSYAYSRHLRDHSAEVPSSLLVLDRECPQCHQTYITNFLYNTHPCAVRTKKCAGCNRVLRNELEYQRHAATCAKIYLKYSTHIPAAAVAAESCVRIKNENDVEAAAAAEALARNAGLSLDMAPVVSLTRMSTPVLLAANHCVALPASIEIDGESELQTDESKQGKKGGKKGVSKKELKRVDELLKSTLDALVSIKHEPEVHVTDGIADGHATGKIGDAETSDAGDSDNAADDFHHGNDVDDSDDSDKASDGVETGTVTKALQPELGIVAVKQEVVDESYKEHYGNMTVKIKQEVMDVREVIDIDAENTPTAKMPVLKLKIKKEHGTLNSSLIDDEGMRSEKKKKKKKRKEAEKGKEKPEKNKNLQESISTSDGNQVNAADAEDAHMPLADVMPRIKQEPLDDALEVDKAIDGSQMQGEATVMTSIPRMQFQIACISSGVDFTAASDADEAAVAAVGNEIVDMNNIPAHHEEILDIKPNREVLDRMLMITSVSSGVEMAAEEEDETTSENCVPAAGSSKARNAKLTPTKTAHRVTPVRCGTGKAVKSTGGAMRKESTEVGVVAGMDLGNIRIKAEPVDRGYEDVYNSQYESGLDTMSAPLNEFTISEVDDEQAYLSTIDFANVKIKQERDEVSEMEMCSSQLTVPTVPNGLASLDGSRRESQMSMEESSSDESSGEEEEETSEMEEEEEVREYREMDLPPLLSNAVSNETIENLNDNEENKNTAAAEHEGKNEIEPLGIVEGDVTIEHTAIITQASTCLKIAAVTAGCTDFHKVAMKNSSEDAVGNAVMVIEPAVEAETLRLEVREEPEATLKAQPFFENTAVAAMVENCVDENSVAGENVTQSGGEEEQQNLLNHEVAEQVLSTAASTLHSSMRFDNISLDRESHAERAPNVGATVPYSTNIPASVNNDEETENLINESAAEAQRLQQQQQQQQAVQPCSSASAGGVRVGSGIAINHFLLDDSNINEIAENNNNANIERELEDVVATAERVRSSELELERHVNDIT